MRDKSSYRYPTIPSLLAAKARQHANACALQTSSGEQLSYGEVHRRIGEISKSLSKLNLGRNSRVAIALPNGINMSVMLLAVTSTSIAAPLNPSYREAEFQSYLSDIGADCIVVPSESHLSPAHEAATKNGIPIIGLGPDGITISEFPKMPGIHNRNPGVRPTNGNGSAEPDDIALILLTSGSTGRPKRVPLTHRNLCTSAADICYSLQLDDQDVCLSMWNQFHIGGVTDLLLVSLASSGRIVCTSGFDAFQFFKILEDQSPTWFQGVPTTLAEIMAVAERTRRSPKPTSLRFVRSVAAPLSPLLMERVESYFQVPVVQTFGMTEAGPLITTNLLPPAVRKPGSTGPSAGPQISIRDPDDRELRPYEMGEIFVRGENVIAGYEGDREATAQSFRNGWFRTGDTGYLDADGYLFLKGRAKEQINRGGEKISPQEIDDVLAAHPEVEQAATFSVKHPTLGEDVGVAVVLRKNGTLDAEGIRRFVAGQLSDFKVPKTVLFLQSLPQSAIGKVKRDALAELAESKARPLTYAPPETKLQSILAEVWAKELDKQKVSIDDDFFSLGGDSLSSVRLMLAIETLLGIQLDTIALDQDLTIRQLGHLIEALPDFGRVSERIAQPDQNAQFAQARIEKLLSNIAAGSTSGASPASDSAEGMRNALLKCDTEHAFDALLESFYTEMTPNELVPLARISFDGAELPDPIRDRFSNTQKFIGETILPLAEKQNWHRHSLSKCIRLYTGLSGEAKDKTLIVGFAGNLFRLMLPMWTFLSHLNSNNTDLLFVWDSSRKHYRDGIPEVADNFPDLVKFLGEMVSRFDYRRVIGYGTSAGGLPALCAGLTNNWESIVAINAAYPFNTKHLLSMLTDLGEKKRLSKQSVRLFYSELRQEDLLATVRIAKMVKGEIRPLIGHRLHNVLWEAHQRGEIPKLFDDFFS
jgi:acyl-CoA synthetase (AMP-forming)/AMP-acid ligase II/acyl carrier protein